MTKKKQSRRGAALAGVILCAATIGAQAAPTPAWEINAVEGFRNSSWSFGDAFTVGANPITVTSLGALDVGLDGFVSTAGIPVGLFRESDGALLASGLVLSGSTLVGNYRFVDINDVQLAANTQYRVVAVNEQDLYNVAVGTPNVVDARITWDRYGYCETTTLTRCDGWSGDERTWMANFQIDTVPEPASMLLVATAGLALAGIRRRKPR